MEAPRARFRVAERPALVRSNAATAAPTPRGASADTGMMAPASKLAGEKHDFSLTEFPRLMLLVLASDRSGYGHDLGACVGAAMRFRWISARLAFLTVVVIAPLEKFP
jgi:hypothetical protein